MQKKKFIDSPLGLLEIIKTFKDNYHLVKLIKFEELIDIYFKGILAKDKKFIINDYKKFNNEQKNYYHKAQNNVLREQFIYDYDISNSTIKYDFENNHIFGAHYKSHILSHIGFELTSAICLEAVKQNGNLQYIQTHETHDMYED